MSLTDAWKAGKLNGCFWCKYPDGHIEAHLLNNLRHESYMDIEVLEPCDYEELQNLKAKNNSLRDLLKECKNIIAHDCWQEAQFPDGQVVERKDLLTRINTAIGESEE